VKALDWKIEGLRNIKGENRMSKVIIQECKNYELETVIAKINAAVEILGGWDKYVKPQNKVLLKVNLIGPKPSDSAAVTHAEFVRAMVIGPKYI